MSRPSRYSTSIRVGGAGSSHRPFATRDALDCSPPRRLRWYQVAALGGAVAVLSVLAARIA